MIEVPVYLYIDDRGNLWNQTVVETDIPVSLHKLSQQIVSDLESKLMVAAPLADRYRALQSLSKKEWTDVYQQILAGKTLDEVKTTK